MYPTGQVVWQPRPGGVSYPIREAKDGVYYTTESGRCLHATRNCPYLSRSCIPVKDPTCTAVYRVTIRQGQAGFRNGFGHRLDLVCESCAVLKYQPVS